MTRTARLILPIALVLTSFAAANESPGMVFLEIWPSARSTGMAGAMTALADEADAAYWNPGGLGFQKSVGLTGNVMPNGWLPGLWSGMVYNHVGAGTRLRNVPRLGNGLWLGVSGTYLSTGLTEVTDASGNLLGSYTSWDAAFGIHAGTVFGDKLGVGVGLKYLHSFLVPEWVWDLLPELGIDHGGTANVFATDFGVLYRPAGFFSIGCVLANVGPRISYGFSPGPRETDALPRMLRVGICLSPLDGTPVAAFVRPRMTADVHKVLVGVFTKWNGQPDFSSARLAYEWQEAWKGVGYEMTFLQFLTLRSGFFADLTGSRIGLCSGLGIGYKDYIRLDIGDDTDIYDFYYGYVSLRYRNIKVALAVNDLAGLFREMREGAGFDWLRRKE